MKKVNLWCSQTQNIVQATKFTTLTEVQKRAVQASEQIALFSPSSSSTLSLDDFVLYLQVTAPEMTEFSSIISKICILLHFAGNEHNLFLPEVNSICSKLSICMVILKEACEQALFLREAARDRRLTRAFSRKVGREWESCARGKGRIRVFSTLARNHTNGNFNVLTVFLFHGWFRFCFFCTWPVSLFIRWTVRNIWQCNADLLRNCLAVNILIASFSLLKCVKSGSLLTNPWSD